MDQREVQIESLAAYYKEVREATDSANRHLHDLQRAVAWGDCWARFFDVVGNVVIFGTVMPESDAVAVENKSGATPRELRDFVSSLHDRHERGYLWGRCHSIAMPMGELGSTHRAYVWPVSERLYDEAREAQWRIKDLSAIGMIELSEAYREYREHSLAVSCALAESD
jgi:hypothetical protein